jgi:16S rRNA (guanine1207-N2)-methyltransferase
MSLVTGVYGYPPSDLAEVSADAIQFSPLIPGAATLESVAEKSLAAIAILAPPGTLERRYTLALALRALQAGGALTALAPKDRGGTRLRKELESFGCEVEDISKRHHRIVTCVRPAELNIESALAEGAPRIVEDLGLWSQPGVFSWDRLDPGSALLIDQLPALSGRGADFGCGIGMLAHAVFTSPAVSELTLIDIDRRAVECARHNVSDQRARFLWADVRDANPALNELDFVVMNAPFHDAGSEDKSLAQKFVTRAAAALRKGGVCWLVANRHLPYEAIIQPLFKHAQRAIETGGYKIYEARK